MDLAFTKMQGCANDYIYLDCRTAGLPQQIEALARKWSARHFSIGADGIVCICAPQTPGAAAFMRIYNADGSEGKMCGNGIRCVAEWLRTHDAACAARDELLIDTLSGPKTLRWQGEGQWQVEMGCYSAMAADLPAVHMGPGPLVGCTLSAAGRAPAQSAQNPQNFRELNSQRRRLISACAINPERNLKYGNCNR